MKNIEKTEKQIERERNYKAAITVNKYKRKLATRVYKEIHEFGMSNVKMRLDYLNEKPNQPLLYPIDHAEYVSAFQGGIDWFVSGVKYKTPKLKLSDF